jgi:hypothetical protein
MHVNPRKREATPLSQHNRHWTIACGFFSGKAGDGDQIRPTARAGSTRPASTSSNIDRKIDESAGLFVAQILPPMETRHDTTPYTPHPAATNSPTTEKIC